MTINKKIFFGSNIAFLRSRRKGLTQELLATDLGITRGSLKNYELEHTINPPLELLLKVSDYFGYSTDTLLKIDLSKLSELQLKQLEAGNDVYIKGGKLRVLATTIDKKNNDNVEYVTIKAKAGYATGYADPEYISELPSLYLPFLSKQKKYRAFQIEGDSMIPIASGSIVIGQYITDWNEVKDGHCYIVVTKTEGVLFKLIERHTKSSNKLTLSSLNPSYSAYDIHLGDIAEIWVFAYYITNSIPDPITTSDQILLKLSSIENLMSIKGNR